MVGSDISRDSKILFWCQWVVAAGDTWLEEVGGIGAHLMEIAEYVGVEILEPLQAVLRFILRS